MKIVRPTLVLLLPCVAAATLAAEPAAYRLPAFGSPNYDTCDGLKAAQLVRRPSESGSGYDVMLVDQGGAEFHGDLAGMVGWTAGSTVSFLGKVTIVACNESAGIPPVVIVGERLKFRLDEDGRFTYVDGSGSVTQGTNRKVIRAPGRAPAPKKK